MSAVTTDPRGPSTVRRASGIRRRTAEHMVRSLATSPHAAMAVEVRFDAVEAARRASAARPAVPAYTAWAVTRALADFPLVNSSWEDGSIRVFEHVNLGVAVDMSHEGLVVPVIRGAHELDVEGLHERITEVTGRARSRALGVADMAGGTFTLSSLGRSGTLFTIPVINQPQAAILSMDTIARRPVVADGSRVEAGLVAVLTMSFDHRVFDGAYAAAFLARVRERLENADGKVAGGG
ncbi:2-oxo acid dehydrogenase subunit E2 [Nonomuraea sp. NPDC050478]|uniref:2-oxo acid dehydrogenase subunit E2 n=1 Tax=Nonomuraea sp. NPDC050478 TaxID=3364365 RepID=UPI0037948B8D